MTLEKNLLHPGAELVPVSAEDWMVLSENRGGFVDVARAFIFWLDSAEEIPDAELVRLSAAITNLRQRDPHLYNHFHAHVVEKFSFVDVARHFSCSVNTARRRVAAARALIRRYLHG